MLTECCEKEILEGLKKNNISAFNTLYSNFSKPLYIYLLQKLKDSELCNDILQDIFVNIWEKRESLNINTSLKAYLYQAARYKIIDIYRNDVKYQRYLADLAGYLMVDPSSITDRIDNRKKLQEIETAVNNMPERMREIFILSRFEHQTTRDIATKTNLSPQTVKNQISKALRLLRVNYISVDILFLFTTLFLFK
ncbi:RNA polymerase sigma-70 factor (ECF subfamily) [Mucilaginibacter frigoritolerans]|jgi:RNA polymerase sigma-70 factor (family 1)|uniref:RNA polymerase sigma-70 factor (ECF subfamily) n=1 Tax=Mucilaginibacter frigoritolerans TaxID=652788 RepID=A0A562TYW6_9SPHI|nr:RNA polymerase sigma-70 factor [Mucilaginibacter frigoritolerans]TWI98802.1 RNA polymerase sigma-70 factor (ECF subfamily) [Mucilaginibacter frigoritolerans]